MRSLAHPLRLQALLLLEFEASPVELQRVLGLPDVSLVARHVRVLRGHGLVDLTRTEVRRGAIEHFYRQSDHAVCVLKAMRPWTGVPARRAGGSDEKRAAQLLKLAREIGAEAPPRRAGVR